MKRGKILGLLVLFLACVITASPAMAANLDIANDSASVYYNHAVQLTADGKYSEAIALYDKALEANTTLIKQTDALLYTFQGKSYSLIQLGNYTAAIATADAGLAEYPKDEILWNNKGFAQYNLGKYTDAVTSYEKAIAIKGNYTGAIINKGDALVKLGKYDDAIATYQSVLADDPNNTETAAKLADAQKSAASALPATTLIVLAVVLIIVAAGVAYYVTKKGATDNKKDDRTPDKNTGTKKNK